MTRLSPAVKLNRELNPLLWQDFKLDPLVREALLKIASKFYRFVQVPVDVHDVIITGSQCGYTYTEHSDLDLHVIVEYGRVACDQPVDELFDTKRKLWRLEHAITVRGIPVECYVEDLDQPVKGNSFSLLKNTWLDRPEQLAAIDTEGVEPVANAWIAVINSALEQGDRASLEQIKSLLKAYRQQGLARQGELGRANLVFKTLRNTGILNRLITSLNRLKDQELTLKN